MCAAQIRGWRYVLADCGMYEDISALSGYGVRLLDDGIVNVERVLECKETYEGFCKFAVNVFEWRRMNVR